MLRFRKHRYKLFAAVIVMGSILVLALAQISKVSEASANSDVSKCDYHGIQADICTRCNPELIPDFKAQGDWCAGHNVAESQCDLCGFGQVHEKEGSHESHQSAVDDEHGDLSQENAVTIDEHQVELPIPERNHGESKSGISVIIPENVVNCTTDEAIIQLASIETAERTGLTIRQANAAQSAPLVESPAEIVFDETKTMVLTTTIPSLVTRWLVQPGQEVSKGTPLAKLTSPEIPEMKAKYLEAHASWVLLSKRHERNRELFDKELISISAFEDIETEFAMARAHLTGLKGMLRSAGLSDADLDKITDGNSIDQEFFIYAPEDGIIIERIATPGQLLEEGRPLAIIGNPSALWIEARVREDQVRFFSIGDRIEFSSDGSSFKSCTGRIIWIAQFLDRDTRTITVRAEIEAASDFLHSGEFGRITLENSTGKEIVLVPKNAVQWEGCCNVVFVKERVDRFRPRKVRIEPGSNGYYKITEGLNAGEEIVVDGSFLLKTELRKGSLGAGCTGH